MIKNSHVAVRIRQILKRFYKVDVKNKKVAIEVAEESGVSRNLRYDQLAILLGGNTDFAKMPHIQRPLRTLKNLKDALVLRNHATDVPERAAIETDAEKEGTS